MGSMFVPSNSMCLSTLFNILHTNYYFRFLIMDIQFCFLIIFLKYFIKIHALLTFNKGRRHAVNFDYEFDSGIFK